MALMLCFTMLQLIVACGDDDNNEANSKVEGVNVPKGKRLAEVEVYTKYLPDVYKIKYDSEGRLSKILYMEKVRVNYYDYQYSGVLSELASIDYEMREITALIDNKQITFNYTLNQEGYFSQIGPWTMNYDENGYLIGVDSKERTSRLTYVDGDVLKLKEDIFLTGMVKYFYVNYGDKSRGNLFIEVRRSYDDENYACRDIYITPGKAVGFIAHQAGLFGKVVKTYLRVREGSEDIAKVGFGWNVTNKMDVGDGLITFYFE